MVLELFENTEKKTWPQWKQVSFSSETAWNGSIIVVGKKKKR